MAEVNTIASDSCDLEISGVISIGDYEFIDRHTQDLIDFSGESTADRVVCLNSIGGNFFEGLKIARLFFDRGVGTYIRENDVCFSTCAVIFMMGTARGPEVNFVNRTLHIRGFLGVHRPSLTLEDASNYTSRDLNYTFDFAVDSIFNFVDLANLREPGGFRQMIAPDFVRIMLGTTSDDIYVVSTVQDAVNWRINLEGVPESEPHEPVNVFYACENILSHKASIRPSDSYQSGLFTVDVFDFWPLSKYSVEVAISPLTAADRGLRSFFVTNLRSGYYSVGCRVVFQDSEIRLCGNDQETGVSFGSCDAEIGADNFEIAYYHHPLSDISLLDYSEIDLFHVARRAVCRIISGASENAESDSCLQLISFIESQNKTSVMHTFLWASGSTTVVSIEALGYDDLQSNDAAHRGAYTINGSPAELSPENKHCVYNTASNNTFCAFPFFE